MGEIIDALDSPALMRGRQIISERMEEHSDIHAHPELAFEEFQAHDNVVDLLISKGFEVTPHAYGVDTSFEARFGQGKGGRVVAFNAEYDALPGIGHACGHNLIATAAVAAFLSVAAALKELNLPGEVRLIGSPAEEGGGGKLPLLAAGAYDSLHACLMVHPLPDQPEFGGLGSAYWTSLANHKLRVSFSGKAAHAAAAPDQGVNALDAVVLAYNALSMLRQQIKSAERVHAVITNGGTRPNVITDCATLSCYVRSTSLADADRLKARVVSCFEGAATATGCTVEVELLNTYADLRPNMELASLWASEMSALASPVVCDRDVHGAGLGSTDMGNVSYVCPSLHAGFGIPAAPGQYNHTPGFTAAAGSDEAYRRTIVTAKAMAGAGWTVLVDDAAAEKVRKDFEADLRLRS
ncbi:hypothetical protein A1O3_05829 [Capronia epimyces CBS 606.96]|uniref:Peptidase M20 domain-containing protein 2 n=1 Tax=Capronia epimyces CBS 606.96 TaxID=1182542 RepID=W9YS92_9EURO|nr:uncharacterized protein A1O3_05829 [Capronia epimyces CBS 606.96]EXJ85154.1 hypothetical protein A1O3_05829 [Capronia epimyces CBS 606.96]